MALITHYKQLLVIANQFFAIVINGAWTYRGNFEKDVIFDLCKIRMSAQIPVISYTQTWKDEIGLEQQKPSKSETFY